MIRYRKVKLSDTQDIVNLGQVFRDESEVYSEFKKDNNELRDLIRMATYQGKVYGELAFSEGTLIGFMFGYLDTPVFSRDVIGVDSLFFVRRDFRPRNVGGRLLRHFEKWREDRGAKHIILSVTSGIRNERVGKLYKHKGYEEIGQIYRRRL